MTQTIPIPADRYDGAFQPVTTVQSWKKHKTVQTLTGVESRTAAQTVRLDHERASFDSMINDGEVSNAKGFAGDITRSGGQTADSEFEFEDFLDIINPLQHLPVISMIYRSLTGDTIKPVASIVGGGLFGGPIGAASGVVNAIVQHETGKDIAGNVFALVTGAGENGGPQTASIANGFKDDPETQLSLAAAQHGLNENESDGTQKAPPPPFAENGFSETAISFADARAGTRAYEKTAIASGRTAGWHIEEVQTKPEDILAEVPFNARALIDRALPEREAIASISFSDLPAIY